MLAFRKILLCNEPFIIIFCLVLLITAFRIFSPYHSKYNEQDTEVIGIITKIEEKENHTMYEIKAKEKILVTVSQENQFQLGDKIQVEGTFQKPSKNTTKYLFNYQEYLKRKRIFYIVKAEKIVRIQSNKKIGYKIKTIIQNHLHQNPYLYTFILGDKSKLSVEVIRSYQENGISHLFAISGMHITLLASLLQRLLKKIATEEKRYKMISLFLCSYVLLVGFSPSIVRGALFYVLFEGNRVYYFYIKKENLFLLALSISLILNPFGIYDIGFQYSYSISCALLKMSDQLTSKRKIVSLLKVSFLSFLVSIPITLKNYYQINLLSILYNLFYVPYVSTIVFPLSLLTFLIPPLEVLYNLMTILLEKTSLFLNQISFGKWLGIRLPNIVYDIYFILIFLFLQTKNKRILYLFLILLGIHLMFPFLNQSKKVITLDVGQGDSTLILLKQKAIMIDTGGKRNQEGELFHHSIEPILKMNGIKKIDILILTHGDYDHMGEAKEVIHQIKVKQVILNCGTYNSLEKDLIQELEKKHIRYEKCINELSIQNQTFYFLNTKIYDNENDNSNVIYTNMNGYQFLWMGDAGIEREKDILEEYDISNMDVLKIGHHGSLTSSSEKFIQVTNPRYALISVGKDNRYGHPNQVVLNRLPSSFIFRTDEDGCILTRIKNGKLLIQKSPV